MNILSWILFGLIVGIVINTIDSSSNKGSKIVSILLGVIGALAGGILANFVFGLAIMKFALSTFLVAIVGSLLVLTATKALRRI